MRGKKMNLSGRRFGRLTVLEEAGRNKWEQFLWKCLCSCGTIKVVNGNNLRIGDTKFCGCLQKERTSEANKGINNNRYKHGLSGTKGYICYKTQKRYYLKLKQTPADANLDLIRFYYIVSETMKDYEVDHIKPLSKGGLHNEDSLQILNRSLNLLKLNKWPLTNEEKIKYKGIRL